MNEDFQQQGKAGIRVWLLGAPFLRRTEVWCAGIGSPPWAVRRPGVRKAHMVAAFAPLASAEATVCTAKTVCVRRFVHFQANGFELARRLHRGLTPYTSGSSELGAQ